MSEAQAARMEAGAEAILHALGKAGVGDDGAAIAAALRVAEGITSGELLDPA